VCSSDLGEVPGCLSRWATLPSKLSDDPDQKKSRSSLQNIDLVAVRRDAVEAICVKS
jgi:hypothetical protein